MMTEWVRYSHQLPTRYLILRDSQNKGRWMSCHEFVVVILHYYGVNVTPPHEDGEAARPSSICLQDIRSSWIHNACKLSSPLWAGYNVTHRLHWCVRFQMIWMIRAQYSSLTMKRKLNPCISSRACSYYITTGFKLRLALPFLPFHHPLPPNLLARDPSVNNRASLVYIVYMPLMISTYVPKGTQDRLLKASLDGSESVLVDE
jgi:hypothetical protein